MNRGLVSDPHPPLAQPTPTTPSQQRALGWMALLAVLVLVWLAAPVASGILLGALIGFALRPVHTPLARRIGPTAAAAVLAVGSAAALLGVVATLGFFVVARGIAVANDLAERLGGGGGDYGAVLERIEALAAKSPIGPIDLTRRARESASSVASHLTSWAASFASVTFAALLMLLFLVLTCHFVLTSWRKLMVRAEQLLPLNPAHTRLVLEQVEEVGKHVIVGTLLTGLAQGLLAGVGFAITGVPEAALLGALTAVASLLPAVGTMLVWVPAGVFLLATGHAGRGIAELAWGALIVVGASDYVIRPALVGSEKGVPALVTFIALFGGVEALGLLGLVVGPVLASVALAIVRTYGIEAARARPLVATDASPTAVPPAPPVP